MFRKRRTENGEQATEAGRDCLEVTASLGIDGTRYVPLDAIRQIGVVEQTYYRWRKQYGGMGVDQLKELKGLQKENEQLRRAVSDLTLDKLILKEAARGNF